jgi:hypothetical protein
MEADDPRLIDELRRNILSPPSSLPYNFTQVNTPDCLASGLFYNIMIQTWFFQNYIFSPRLDIRNRCKTQKTHKCADFDIFLPGPNGVFTKATVKSLLSNIKTCF